MLGVARDMLMVRSLSSLLVKIPVRAVIASRADACTDSEACFYYFCYFFIHDEHNKLAYFRPRINKMNSVKDVDQKRSGNYFFLDN